MANPPPKPGLGDVWGEVIREIDGKAPEPLVMACESRRLLGIERYGQPLQREDGRDHAVDLLEELLDGAVYAQSIGRVQDRDRLLHMANDLLTDIRNGTL